MLHSAVDARSNTVFSETLGPFMAVSADWFGRNSRSQLLLTLPNTEFHSDADHFTEAQMSADWLYHDYLWKHGIGYAAATWIKVPNGDNLIISIERERASGPFHRSQINKLTSLRPHLARAAMLAARVDLDRLRAANNVFETVGMPAAAISAAGAVIDCNDSFSKLDTYLSLGGGNKLHLASAPASCVLAEALSRASLVGSDGFSFPVAGHGTVPAIIHLIPVRKIARDLFSRAVYFIVVTPVVHPSVPSAELIQGLFDLTTSEARIAREIAAGKELSAIADTFELSRETVRHHLKNIFAKTGYSRQADLTAAIGNIPTMAS